MAQATSEISFIGTGDCGPVHGPADGFPVERYTELVRPVLEKVDLRFEPGEVRALELWMSAAREAASARLMRRSACAPRP